MAPDQSRILIIDGSDTLAMVYKACFEDAGFKVSIAHSSEDAISAIERAQPHLITLGTELKDADGIALCYRLKSDKNFQHLPIIFISAHDDLKTITQIFNAGALDIIQKDSNTELLVQRVKSILERAEGNNEHNYVAPYRVLVADDSPSLQSMYRALLSQMGCNVNICSNGQEAWHWLCHHKDHPIDLIVTDMDMPIIPGDELVQKIRQDSFFQHTPIVVISGTKTHERLNNALANGANDYLHKPFHEEEFIARINAHLRQHRQTIQQLELQAQLRDMNLHLEQKVLDRTRELYDAQIDTLFRLALACDSKDQDTANHILRVRYYTEELAKAAGLDDKTAEFYGVSSMMHDIGKLSIPDAVLTKPGPLNDEEWVIMQKHTIKGEEILGERDFFQVSREVARSHHEKYDGTGYPDGIKGENIPLCARIVAVVDVFDALTAERPYKAAWPIEEALAELNHLSGQHFDPILTAYFIELEQQGQLTYIRQRYP